MSYDSNLSFNVASTNRQRNVNAQVLWDCHGMLVNRTKHQTQNKHFGLNLFRQVELQYCDT